MLDSLFNFIEQAPAGLVFLSIFLASYIENIFPPIPGDTIVIFGAYLVGRGNLSFVMALTTTLLGSVLGFMTLYYVGFHYGRRLMYSERQTWFTRENLIRVESLFEKWGYGVVFINRFLAGLRSVTGIFSGLGKLSIWKVTLLATLSSLLWNGTLIWLGSSIGENWEQISVYLKRYNGGVTLILTVILAVILFRRYVLSKRHPEQTGR